MEDAFHLVRRRRIFNEKIPDKFIKAIDFTSLRCSCEEAEGNPIPALKDFVGRSVAVTEIVLARDVTCILTDDGVAMALNGATLEKLCVLNSSPLFVVRSICYNSCNDTIIIICHSRALNHGLTISVLDRERVKNGNPIPVYKASKLQNLVIPYPGFVEFEEPNKRIVTSTPHDRLFCFWSMETYDIVFTMPNSDFKEIRISAGTVAFFKQPFNNCLPVKLCSIEDGTVMAECELPLQPQRDLRFLELCGSYLLLKQEGSCICVHDLFEGKAFRMKDTKGFFPRAVTFFTADGQECGRSFGNAKNPTFFLAVHDTSMEICSCANGELVSIAKIAASPPEHPADCLQVVQSHDILLVYTNGRRAPGYCVCNASCDENNIQEELGQPQSLFERWRRGEIDGSTEIEYDSPSLFPEDSEVWHDNQDAIPNFQEDEDVFSITPVPCTPNSASFVSEHMDRLVSEESLQMSNSSSSVFFPEAVRMADGANSDTTEVVSRVCECSVHRDNASWKCWSSAHGGRGMALAQRPSSPFSHLCGVCNNSMMDETSEAGPGISIVDLRTGKQTGFVPMPCETAIYVLVYDSVRKEILAGGSKGFHRLKASFDHAGRDVKRRKVERTDTVGALSISCGNQKNIKKRRLSQDRRDVQSEIEPRLSVVLPYQHFPSVRPVSYDESSGLRTPESTVDALNELGSAMVRLLRWNYFNKKKSLHTKLTITPELQHSAPKAGACCSDPVDSASTGGTTVTTASLSPFLHKRVENCGGYGRFCSNSIATSSVPNPPSCAMVLNSEDAQCVNAEPSSLLSKQRTGVSRRDAIWKELEHLSVTSEKNTAHESLLYAGQTEALEVISLLRAALRCLCSLVKRDIPHFLGLVVSELLLPGNGLTLDSQCTCQCFSQFLQCFQNNSVSYIGELYGRGDPVPVEATRQVTLSAITSAFRCLSCQSSVVRPYE